MDEIELEIIRERLKKRRGVDIPVSGERRLLLIPKTAIHNKHRSQKFLVVLSNAGFFEFHPRELENGTLNVFTLRGAGFAFASGIAVIDLLCRLFKIVPPENTTLIIHPKTTS